MSKSSGLNSRKNIKNLKNCRERVDAINGALINIFFNYMKFLYYILIWK
jgi:hypothetical protein